MTSVKPPAIYSFPPFFTRQRNEALEKQRKEDWVGWIVTWAKARRMTELLVERELGGELFCNKTIGRGLSRDDAVDVLEYMRERGNGEWLTAGKDKFLVLYRSYAEWAKLVFDWVDSTGQMGSVFTVYELLESDATAKEEFHGIEQPLMIKVLTYMQDQLGTATLFTAADPSKMGVKIFKV